MPQMDANSIKRNFASADAPKPVVDRRRHARYRWSIPIMVHPSGGSGMPGMSLEISESGMSALMSAALTVGDVVELAPIAEDRVSALVRRQNGKIYSFEFLNLTVSQHQRIADRCKVLPLYRSNSLDI